MSSTEENKAALREAYRRWHETKGASVEHWMSIIADDVAFGSLAEGRTSVAFTAQRHGKATLKGYFDGLTGGWSMNHYTVNHFVAEGDRVVAIGSTSWTNRATGKVCETPKVDVWRFANGKVVEFYEYYDTAAIIEAAGGAGSS